MPYRKDAHYCWIWVPSLRIYAANQPGRYKVCEANISEDKIRFKQLDPECELEGLKLLYLYLNEYKVAWKLMQISGAYLTLVKGSFCPGLDWRLRLVESGT